MTIVKTIELTKIYVNGNEYTHALDKVSLEIQKGELLAIMGYSGSGKTTLLNIIGGLDLPSYGMVYINNIPICDLNEDERCTFRRKEIGFVFQNYNLLPTLNAYENIVLPLMLEGGNIDKNFLADISLSLGIDTILQQMPYTLSGGQQQRVAIARALCTKPSIILADEPTGNIDSKAGMEVITLLKKIAAEYNQTVVLVTHSKDIAMEAERIIYMKDGKSF